MREETASFDEAISGVLFHEIATQPMTACKALLRRPVKSTVSPSSLDHGVYKNNKKNNKKY
ncbi:hypothetical protein [Rickettsia hoogstraalii]|uniref:hypothetical protein n=1 Tax=Rickettsia hoogstraalii TaxID=467174 RepID=UPI000B22FDAB|nr:hypothetical protein [Rickettsia hoogstraalii]